MTSDSVITIDQLPEIDIMGEAFPTDPDGFAMAALAKGPIARSVLGVEVLAYDKLMLLLRDPRFGIKHMDLVDSMNFPEGPAKEFKERMLLSHGRDDYRQRIRQCLTKIVGPSEVEKQRPVISQIVTDLLDKRELENESDLLNDFAFLVPSILYCHWFGAPYDDAPWVAKISDQLLKIFTRDISCTPDIIAGYDELFPYIQKRIDEARENPSDNLLHDFIVEHEAGNIDEQELFDIVAMFNEASTDNTANAIAIAIAQLLSDKDLWHAIGKNPDLIKPAIQESARMLPRSNALVRWALEDLVFENIEIPKGTVMHGFIYATQRDPEVYQDPLNFDLQRKKISRILDFGGGITTCLGMHVALIEIEEAVKALTSRYPDAELLNFNVEQNPFVNTVKELKVNLRKNGV